MVPKNIFDGDSYQALFAHAAYKLLKTHRWFTYKDVMETFRGKEIERSVSKCDYYGELKKVFPRVRKLIEEREGKDSFEEKGNARNRSYRYSGKNDDPLNDVINAVVIKDLKKYWQFCQDSAAFFPISWLEYFFRNSQDLLNIKNRKQRGKEQISASSDQQLKNIELLPSLYDAIKKRQVLSFEYFSKYNKVERLVFHPHYLKEYNGRWFLFGYAKGLMVCSNIALDRIQTPPKPCKDESYRDAPDNFYVDYFRDIVGVSHIKGENVKDIRIRAYTSYMFNLMETKPIHSSQRTIVRFTEGNWGEFCLHVKVNKELIGRILQMGKDLEVVAPSEVRKIIMDEICEMKNRYVENNSI